MDNPPAYYIREGTCNRCGECCGYPRATDGGQNNPWPLNLEEMLTQYSDEAILQISFFKYISRPDSHRRGTIRTGGRTFIYTWTDQGFCNRYGNIRCPFLLDDEAQHPCGIYGTELQGLFDENCKIVPAEQMDIDSLMFWIEHCPSCSYTWRAFMPNPKEGNQWLFRYLLVMDI